MRGGGGLIVMGEYEQAKYGNNLNELLDRFGLTLRNDSVQDYDHHDHRSPSWIFADLAEGTRGHAGDLLARVDEAVFYRATTIESRNGAAVLARTHDSASVPNAPLAVSTTAGAGRVVVLSGLGHLRR